MTHRLAVLISGTGSNLQAILDAIDAGELPARVSLVLSNKAGAAGLARAERAGVPAQAIDHRGFPDRASFDQAMIERIDAHGADTVVLAGFMRILSPGFVRHYQGRLINIHPSLLPKYPGLNTHARALEAGDREHGCSLHFVTDELDGGPLIAQARFPVAANDTAETLSEKVQAREHRLYPQVLRWRAQQRLQMTDQGVELDGERLPAQGFQMDTHG
ncbi:MAG: phosphoribosylglycinamide formyltransferase [Alloalcanivorax venustensis]|jgi:phosphoribosylglycinamide formyltransferase 1|uniref:Phosphoribosylglycinamide formyltransferase n=1 Tax=Alloalcanivorax venustensis ISO4 TaxID=1177184 RepID=A0ABS0AJQ1_9GAMM|nr:phosphoribosylglycinamide formyltransferase [Alloalcanivorax venustensis]MAQ32861.1 phosphoribosylglycinamide formyltransferase [Alcanivorax sp.]MEC8879895.1 phosphoribosylglycinamide formyltransferase [Pseudomonadota bacterium]SMO71469.1 phosphoribosylglycinamide formyltransferase-1 [Alcanivorax sp. DSM 26295]MBF5053455.1 phosphoribosylglycinamide formyltransferase [Alloalcanivorax venustensis ISO4]MBT74036.1 phosphoribosylglycinamide formyltransferase [Alcanivorax sp.]|tara:strand:+ start:48765 stop:49415 length:651 start_codon:yes stop_codon:yes gene_type:complete